MFVIGYHDQRILAGGGKTVCRVGEYTHRIPGSVGRGQRERVVVLVSWVKKLFCTFEQLPPKRWRIGICGYRFFGRLDDRRRRDTIIIELLCDFTLHGCYPSWDYSTQDICGD